MTGIEPRPQRWEARVFPLCHRGPRTVKEIEANLCFAIFGEGKIFLKLPRVEFSDTLWVENFDEIALSRTVKEIEANLCFAIFSKNSKIQNGCYFGGEENFLKIAKSTFLRYPMG